MSAPDFAIFQNDNLRMTAIWTKQQGKWIMADEREYEAFSVIATMLRNHEDPQAFMQDIAGCIQKFIEDNA